MHTGFYRTYKLSPERLPAPQCMPGPLPEDPRFSYPHILPTDRSPCSRQGSHAISSPARDKWFLIRLHSAIENTLVQPCLAPCASTAKMADRDQSTMSAGQLYTILN